jgi:hypothetical protein
MIGENDFLNRHLPKKRELKIFLALAKANTTTGTSMI